MLNLDAIKARLSGVQPSTPEDHWRDIRALVSEVEQLQQLRLYASHKHSCKRVLNILIGVDLPCTCGLDALIAQQDRD